MPLRARASASTMSRYGRKGHSEVLRVTSRCVPPRTRVSRAQLPPLSTRMASFPAMKASAMSAPAVSDLPAPVSAHMRP